MFKVLVSDPIADKGIDILKDAGFEVIYEPNLEEAELAALVCDINAWVIRSGTQITSNFLEDAKELQIIGRAGVGVDNIDIEEATNKGIIIMNNPDGNTISAAEHTIAMMMALSRNIQIGHMDILSGEWKSNTLVGSELKGKILGVVGLGRIGREVIKRALGLEMKIIGNDPYVNKDLFKSENVDIVSLDTIIEEADFITLHIPLLDSTNYLFDIKRISKMKSTARIINVARGGIINEKDLSNALNQGIIAGAAIDVFENEPISADHPFVKTKNILLTPHLGASTHEASEGVSFGICRQIRDFLLEGKLSNPINMPISDISQLNKLKPFLELATTLGKIGVQIADSPIISISIECFGSIDETKLIALAFLIGLFRDITDSRINFVNAGVIANERGISYSHSLNSEYISFTNLIVSHVTTKEDTFDVAGSVFGDMHPRIVNIMGYEVDVRPEGNMLFVRNKDVPGVIGKVGMILGEGGVNIAEYLLSRTALNNAAYSIIKVDGQINMKLLKQLNAVDEVLNIKQLQL